MIKNMAVLLTTMIIVIDDIILKDIVVVISYLICIRLALGLFILLHLGMQPFEQMCMQFCLCCNFSNFQELSDQYSKPSKQPINRISFIFSSILPPHWTIEVSLFIILPLFPLCNVPVFFSFQRELGEMLDNLGLTKSAVEVFERLQMWDDIIRCHVSLNNRNKVCSKGQATLRHYR